MRLAETISIMLLENDFRAVIRIWVKIFHVYLTFMGPCIANIFAEYNQ